MADDIEDTENELPAPPSTDDDSDAVPTSAAAPTPTPQNTPPPVSPVIASYLQNKQAMADAQQKSSTSQLIAGLARAGGQIANSTYGATAPKDESAYDALDRAAQAPVQNLLTKQKADAENLSNEKKEEDADPSSAKSKAVQSLIQRLYPGKFTPDQLSKLSAADAESTVFKPLELDEKIKAAQATKAAALEDHKARVDSKTTADQDKTYTTMRKDLETFRGNQSAQQAALAVQNSDKALALVNSTPTTQNLNLLADEMGKIATGGVPGEHGTQSLLPNNLYTKVAEIKNWVTGHPNASAPEVKEYLDNNRDYINQVRSISQKTLQTYRGNIAKGYRHRVGDSNYQEAVDDYGLGIPDASGGATSQATPPPAPHGGKYPPGSVVSVRGKQMRVGSDGDTLEPL